MIHTLMQESRNTAAVVPGGNVVMNRSWQDEVKVILVAYYPGMESGSALTDILLAR